MLIINHILSRVRGLTTSNRLHAFRDLKAYVCTLGGAECDAELFEDRDSWFEHELQRHRSQYFCILCRSAGFSHLDLQAHILKAHGDFSDAQINMIQEGGRECPTEFEARDCPFCDDWAEILLQKSKLRSQSSGPIQGALVNRSRFKRHVASHQEQLAIFAVPKANIDENTSDSASNSHLSAMSASMAMDVDISHDIDIPAAASSGHSTENKNNMLDTQKEHTFTEAESDIGVRVLDTVTQTLETWGQISSLKSITYRWRCVCIIRNFPTQDM